jgi:hypothetical protein
MSFLSGLLRTVAPLALTALTGGAAAPFMAMAMKAIASEILKMAIDYVGQQLNASFGDISRAQSSVNDRFETTNRSVRDIIQDYGDQVGASLTEIGQQQSAAEMTMKQVQDNIKETFANMSPARREKVKGGRSWLQVMADAMSQILDASLKKVDAKSTALADIQRAGGSLKGQAAADNAAQSTKANSEFAVANQEFSILMNSVNTAIKTIGEGLATMARKQ